MKSHFSGSLMTLNWTLIENTEQTNKGRWVAYKNYLDEIEEKENMELSEMLDEMQEQNAIVYEGLKEEEM